MDFHAESLALAQAVRRTPSPDDDHHAHAERLHRAGDVIWGRSRDHQQSATIADLFTEAGLDHDPDLLDGLLRVLGAAHRSPTPRCGRCGRSCAPTGLKVGVLSNTIWPREWHVGFFERDGVYDLVDGDVYTSEIPWTKPSPRAFGAAMDGRRRRPTRRAASTSGTGSSTTCGAPTTPGCGRSTSRSAPIPADQVGHTEGEPDAAITSLREVPDVVRRLDAS